MKHLLPLLGWLVIVIVVLFFAMGRSMLQDQYGTREVYFAIAEGQEVAVRLLADEPRIRILAHLETPDPLVVDETTTWPFGMRVSVEPEEGAIQVRDHWTHSRRTVEESGEPAIADPEPGHILTDSRILIIEPGHLVPKGGLLRIRPLLEEPTSQRLLLRIFRERPARRMERLRLLGSPDQLLARMKFILPYSWVHMDSGELGRLSSYMRERLSPEEFTGVAVPVHRLSGPSWAPARPTQGFLLDSGAATAVNLVGPSTLTLSSTFEARLPVNTSRRVPLQVDLVDASEKPVHPSTLDPFRIDVPQDSVWSIRWYNPWDQAPVLMRFTLSPPAGRSWGEPPGAGGEQAQAPEQRRITLFHLDKNLPPIEVPVATGNDFGSLAVEARPRPPLAWLADSDRLAEGDPVTITFTAFDDDDRELGSGHFEASFRYTPFERYVGLTIPFMSEETRRHVFHPFRAAHMEFTADGPVDLRFLVPVEVEALRAAKYRTSGDFDSRYAPWELAPYVTISPRHLNDLVEQDRLVRFDATVRIEPVGIGRGSTDRLSTAQVEPLDNPPRFPLVERFTGNAGSWKSWLRTRIAQGTTMLTIPPDGTLEVDYRVTAPEVGLTTRIDCGGAEASALLMASGGKLTFRHLPAGPHRCTFKAPAGEFLARAQGEGEKWVHRTVFRADGRTLRMPIPVEKGGTAQVFVRAYGAPGAPPPTLEILVDDGQPRRHGGPSTDVTRGRRELVLEPLPSGSRLEDFTTGAVDAFAGVTILLADDLAAGTHMVSARPLTSSPVYLRFDATVGRSLPDIPQNFTRDAHCDIVEASP